MIKFTSSLKALVIYIVLLTELNNLALNLILKVLFHTCLTTGNTGYCLLRETTYFSKATFHH